MTMKKWLAEFTVEGVIVDVQVIHAIISTGRHTTVEMVKLNVDSAVLTDFEVKEWPLPETLYFPFDQIVADRPDIGDRVSLIAEVGTAALANAEDAPRIAKYQENQFKEIVGKARSFSKRFAGSKKPAFDELTAQYIDTEIDFDGWLAAQKELMPTSKMLDRLQTVLTTIEKPRRAVLKQSTHQVAVAESLISVQLIPGGRFPHHNEPLGKRVGERFYRVSSEDADAEFARIEAEAKQLGQHAD
ncbi:hypothetical protein [Lacticaseibacillus sp. GG6-2]